MKSSKFNTFFIYDSAQIGYNSLSGEFFILDPLLYELYAAGVKKNDFSELEEIHPEYYRFLVDQGFLVEEDFDEFEFVKQQSSVVDNNTSSFLLTVNPTMNCNFKCWYCYETHIKDSKMDQNTIDAVLRLAKNVIENQKGLKYFSLSFFGGEPLLYFDKVITPMLIAISSLCAEKNIHFVCGMTTNGLLINQKMLSICNKYSLNSFQITLDGNQEQHDKVRFISEGRGSYSKIVSNIILAAKNKITINVRINCSEDTMNNINRILDDFEQLSDEVRSYIHFDFHKVWQEEAKIESKIRDAAFLFKDMAYNVQGLDNNNRGSVLDSCYADKRYQATINYNGEVFKCTARDFKNDSGEGILNSDGTIIWNERYEKRLNIKFKNAPCRECRILPLCGGGCTQAALESEGTDYCVYGFDEEAKTQTIVNRFKTLIA